MRPLSSLPGLRRPALLAVVGLVALGLAGCSPRPERPRTGPLAAFYRFITEPPEEGKRPVIAEESTVFTWTFRSDADLAPWTPTYADLLYARSDGLLLSSSNGDPFIFRDADFAAAAVDLIRVRESPLQGGGKVQVFWAGPGEPFREEASLSSSQAIPDGKLVSTFVFPVHRHPAWTGTIRSFRLDPISLPERHVEVFEVSGLALEVRPERVAAATAEAWRVDLGHDARVSLLAPPGTRHARRLEVPRGARLRFGYGVDGPRGPDVTFRATVRHGLFRRERVIFERTVAPSEGGGRWHEADVDLAAFAGKSVEIAFETSTPSPLDLRACFPVVASPEVVAPGPDAPPLNVVLIVVDTLRADRTSLYGHARRTTPNLDAWARRRGVVFDSVIASAPWTLPSHASLFSGRDAMSHGVNYGLPAPPDLETLAERLREAGYATAAVTGGAYLAPAFGLDQGFDRFLHTPEGHEPTRLMGRGKDLDWVLDTARRWLDQERREPFFLFLHTYEVHTPFSARQPFFSQLSGRPSTATSPVVATRPSAPAEDNAWRYDARYVRYEPAAAGGPLPERDLELVRDLYDSGVAATDALLGPFLASLEESGLADRTLVVLTSDHGDALGDKGYAGHANLYDFNLKVPLVIALPDRRAAGSRVARQVRLIDVAPSVLDLLGLPPFAEAEGQSLLPLVASPMASFPRLAESYAGSSNHGLSLRVDDRWKLIYEHGTWPPVQGERRLFDLTRDPAENDDRAAFEGIADKLVADLRERFLAKTSNLRLAFRNRLATPMTIGLRGEIAHPFNSKGFELPAGCVEFRRGEILVTTPPGRDLTLFFEGRARGELVVRSGEELFVVDLGGLAEAWSLEAPAPAVARTAPLPAAASGVELRWHGHRSVGGDSTDESLRDQLQNLGYAH